MSLTSIRVALGHETKVAFTLVDVPDTFTRIEVINTAFTDISRNKSALPILKPGTKRRQFELTAENGHTATLARSSTALSRFSCFTLLLPKLAE